MLVYSCHLNRTHGLFGFGLPDFDPFAGGDAFKRLAIVLEGDTGWLISPFNINHKKMMAFWYRTQFLGGWFNYARLLALGSNRFMDHWKKCWIRNERWWTTESRTGFGSTLVHHWIWSSTLTAFAKGKREELMVDGIWSCGQQPAEVSPISLAAFG